MFNARVEALATTYGPRASLIIHTHTVQNVSIPHKTGHLKQQNEIKTKSTQVQL